MATDLPAVPGAHHPDGSSGPLTVTIGVLTRRRPEEVARALLSLGDLERDAGREPPWVVSEVLVIDNDTEPSARHVVRRASTALPHPVRYVHEPRPGLAAARNRALDEARGRVLVFLDDDETAGPGWPGGLVRVLADQGAALVGGPVRTAYRTDPPDWVELGRFFHRAGSADGAAQHWLRSGNLAIDLDAVRRAGVRFDQRFAVTGGEDVAFSRTAAARGLTLRWSATAPVTEVIGPERTTLGWLVGRERRSTSNWVRVERDLDPSPLRAAVIAGRAGIRLAQGALLAALGAARRDHIARNRGLVTAARGLGGLHGLRAWKPAPTPIDAAPPPT